MKAIDKTLSDPKSAQKSLLTALLGASDPESGAKLTLQETVASSTGFMSNTLDSALTIELELLIPRPFL
jgi:hypothetical protein